MGYCCQESYGKLDSQALLKAKFCPRATPVQHFVNPGPSRQGDFVPFTLTQRILSADD